MIRTLRQIGRRLEELIIEHKFGENEHYNDVEFTAEANDESFTLHMERSTGRDMDNRDSSDWAEIDLNEDEARELHMLIHCWLEERALLKSVD